MFCLILQTILHVERIAQKIIRGPTIIIVLQGYSLTSSQSTQPQQIYDNFHAKTLAEKNALNSIDAAGNVRLDIGFLAENDLQIRVLEEAYFDILETVNIDHRINFTFESRLGCRRGESAFHASDLFYMKSMDALIGPICPTEGGCVDGLASHLGIPHFQLSPSTSSVFDEPNDAVQSTSVEMSIYNTDAFSEALHTLIRNTNWKTLAIIYDVDSPRIRAYMQKIELGMKMDFDFTLVNLSLQNIRSKNVAKRFQSICLFTRVILLMTEPNNQLFYEVFALFARINLRVVDFVIILPWLDGVVYRRRHLWSTRLAFSAEKTAMNEIRLPFWTPSAKDDLQSSSESTNTTNEDQLIQLYEGCFLFENIRNVTATTARFFNRLVTRQNFNDSAMMDFNMYGLIYDSLKMYMLAVDGLVRQFGPIATLNGTLVLQYATNLKFEGVSGLVDFSRQADLKRSPFYGLSAIQLIRRDSEQDKSINLDLNFLTIAKVFPNAQFTGCTNAKCFGLHLVIEDSIQWYQFVSRGILPAANFFNLFSDTIIAVGALVSILLLILFAIGFFLYRHTHAKLALSNSSWLIPIEEVKFLRHSTDEDHKQKKATNRSSSVSDLSVSFSEVTAGTFPSSTYQNSEHATVFNNVVKLCRFRQLKTITFDVVATQLFNQIKQLVHDNVNPLVGICCNNSTNELLVLWKFYTRGTLSDYLHNSNLRMDMNFKIAFMRDIITGLEYLHSSPFGYHGYLHSSNCVIDANFIVKIVAVGVEDLLDEWRGSATISDNVENAKDIVMEEHDKRTHHETEENQRDLHTATTMQIPEIEDARRHSAGNGLSSYSLKTLTNDIVGVASGRVKFNTSSTTLVDTLNRQSFTSKNLRQFAHRNFYTPDEDFFIFYRAPEHLRISPPTRIKILRMGKSEQLRHKNGYRMADVYALGMLLYEVLYRRRPFSEENLPRSELISALKTNAYDTIRPNFPKTGSGARDAHPTITSLIKSCWNETPIGRPNIRRVRKVFSSVYKMNGSLVTSVISMMDQHSHNLEKQVRERTRLLEEAQIRADRLLTQMLPKDVAKDLKLGKPVLPRSFASSSVLFTDIVGFTNICSDSTPVEIVNFLNDLFTGYDNIIGEMDAFKVETIGDAYLVVSGVPTENGTEHANVIAQIALRMRKYLRAYKMPHLPSHKMQARWGIHSGPVAAGVVGLTAPRYCLFGDTVNMASRMESSGLPERIQMSSDLHDLLVARGDPFSTRKRGVINVKGKGDCVTYWLLDEGEPDRESIAFDKDDNIRAARMTTPIKDS